MRSGTGRSAVNASHVDYAVAGKTGTTDNYRDSWFAGFSGNYLTVVWVGRDDNQSTGLTGASGAAKIWATAMENIPMQKLELGYLEQITSQTVYYSSNATAEDCDQSRQLPVLLASLPLENVVCNQNIQLLPSNQDEEKHFEPKPTPQPKRQSIWKRIFGSI